MIDFEHVTKVYPNGTRALNDVSLHIEKGEFAFIVGSSGAGKSTLLKLISREEKMTSGEIVVNGFRLSKIRQRQIARMRRTIGMVFQDYRLIPELSVYDNVAFAMRVVDASPHDIVRRVPYVLSLVGLENKMQCNPAELSGGEQQRVAIARALVNNPLMIVADEPTGNVDPQLSYEIIELLTEINNCGTTVVVVTHEHGLVRYFQKRVITIKQGEVVSDTSDWRAQ